MPDHSAQISLDDEEYVIKCQPRKWTSKMIGSDKELHSESFIIMTA